ncbi:BEN domain-containing protein 6 [Ambystoma mexicanum]|uniref:BEN domain-containing protein 6 n=1 Tax=Ambystoma mexicanum TaxID=8296 RepID=UPI0037E8ADC6
MMEKHHQAKAIKKGPGLGKRKSNSIKVIFSESDNDDLMDAVQEENYPPNALLYGESSSDEDDPMYHLSKLELCAKIRSLKRKLTHTTRENVRLRQSLVLLQVLPQAVSHFEELVGMADALLKGGANKTATNVESARTWNTPNIPLTESSTALQNNCDSPVLLTVIKEEASSENQFKIENWQIALCNKSKPQKFINDLMQALYTHEYMATHSLTGAKSSSSKDRAAKPAMNPNEVQEIIGVTKQLFSNIDDALIRRMMGQKLNNCTKKQNASKDHSTLAYGNQCLWLPLLILKIWKPQVQEQLKATQRHNQLAMHDLQASLAAQTRTDSFPESAEKLLEMDTKSSAQESAEKLLEMHTRSSTQRMKFCDLSARLTVGLIWTVE